VNQPKEKIIKICQYPGCNQPTNRHSTAKYCWPCSKKMNDITGKKSALKIKAKKNGTFVNGKLHR